MVFLLSITFGLKNEHRQYRPGGTDYNNGLPINSCMGARMMILVMLVLAFLAGVGTCLYFKDEIVSVIKKSIEEDTNE